MIVLETERLVLRHLTSDDAGFILGLVNEPSWLQFIGDRNVHSLDDACRYIASGPAASYAENGYGLWLTADRATGEPLGICGLVKRPTFDNADVGFAFLPAHWSKGYAYESAAAVLTFAATTLAMPRVLAVTSPENVRSIALLKKLGLGFSKMVRFRDDGAESMLFSTDA